MDVFPLPSQVGYAVALPAALALVVLIVLRARNILPRTLGWILIHLATGALAWGLVGLARLSNPVVRLGEPAALLLLVFVPFIWMRAARLKPIGTWRRWTALALRTAIVLLFILGLAQTQRVRENDDLAVYYLLDVSKSIAPQARRNAIDLINEAARQMGRNDRAGMIVFGEDASIEDLPRHQFEKNSIDSAPRIDATNIEAAVRLALASFPADTQRRMVLFTDMNENRGSVLSEVRSAAGSGVALDVFPLGVAERKEVLVDKLVVPTEVNEEETFDVDVFLSTTHPDMPVKVRLYRDNTLVAENDEILPEGKRRLTLSQTLADPGFYNYEVRIESPEDTNAENNAGYAFTYVSGTSKVLFVQTDPLDTHLPQALRDENIELDIVPPAALPESLAGLQTYDSVILSNVHAGDMTGLQRRMLESAVRDFGIGLVMVGGDQSYGVGGYNGSEIERALPVEMEIKQKKVIPSGALVLIMHSVEIPDGQRWGREISAKALEVLDERDQIGLLLWDYSGGEKWLFPLQEARNKASLLNKIQSMTPGDMPAFDPTMRLAYNALRGAEANKKHIIILSDGDPSPPTPALIRSIADAQISISTIMIYPHSPDAGTLMKSIAEQTGGRFHHVMGPDELPQIFIKEASVIRKSLIFEGSALPDIVQFTDSIRGIEPGELPDLYGYVATTAKARAEVPIVSKDDYPILAQWRYGLGRTVAFTSDAKGRWGRDWVQWAKYDKFWSQVVRWSMRSVEKGNVQVTTEIRDGKGHLVVDAYEDDRKTFANYLQITGTVVDPGIDAQSIELIQTQPGRYEAQFDVADIGNYMVNLNYLDTQGVQRSYVAGTSLSYSAEYRDIQPNRRLVTQVVETSGGMIRDSLAGVFDHNLPKTRSFHPLWPILLLIAILLMPVDIFIRRVILDREQLAAGLRKAAQFLPIPGMGAPVPQTDESMDRLLSVKERVKAQRAERPTAAKDAGGQPAFLSERVQKRTKTTVLSGEGKRVTLEQPTVSRPQDKPGAAGQPSAFTKRLLEAKKRARERQGGDNKDE